MQSEDQTDFWFPIQICFLMKSIPKRGVPSLTLVNTPLQKGALITSGTLNTVLKIWVVIWALPELAQCGKVEYGARCDIIPPIS